MFKLFLPYPYIAWNASATSIDTTRATPAVVNTDAAMTCRLLFFVSCKIVLFVCSDFLLVTKGECDDESGKMHLTIHTKIVS
ncbi:Adenylate cyclase type [Dirofilaria immitis]